MHVICCRCQCTWLRQRKLNSRTRFLRPQGLLKRKCLNMPMFGPGNTAGATHLDFLKVYAKIAVEAGKAPMPLGWPKVPSKKKEGKVSFPTLHEFLRAQAAHEAARNKVPVRLEAPVGVANLSAIFNKDSKATQSHPVESLLPFEVNYLRDYAFHMACPGMIEELGVPHWLAEDWDNALKPHCAVETTHPHLMSGVSGSRGPMHIDTYNAEAWSLQLQGRKAWFMADPNVPLSDPTALCTVVQHANTLLYIPRSTMHGTLNLDLSLSIINNFFDGYSIADTEFADGDDDNIGEIDTQRRGITPITGNGLGAQCNRFYYADSNGTRDHATLEERCARSRGACKDETALKRKRSMWDRAWSCIRAKGSAGGDCPTWAAANAENSDGTATGIRGSQRKVYESRRAEAQAKLVAAHRAYDEIHYEM
jgi:hypothetical protein